MLMAGLDGIQNKLDPGAAMPTRTSTTCRRKKRSRDPAGLPSHSTAGTGGARCKDRDFLKAGGVFSDDLIDAYIDLKMDDVTRLRMTTHPAEFDMYYSL